MPVKIGAITIGQSPRTDVIPEIQPLLGGVKLAECGALDGLSPKDIAPFAPEAGECILVTRLFDGTSVRIAERHILPRIQTLTETLISDGAAAILMLCTGEFPPFRCEKPLIYPQVILHHFVAGVIDRQRLGIITPDVSQIPQSLHRWHKNGIEDVIVEASNPYMDAFSAVSAACALKERGAALIVLDCIGYTAAMKASIQKQTGLPVILPRTVAARAVAELFG